MNIDQRIQQMIAEDSESLAHSQGSLELYMALAERYAKLYLMECDANRASDETRGKKW
jgi:hypothetical protein